LGYPRQLRAQNDRLAFTSHGGDHRLGGGSSPVEVFDVSDPTIPALVGSFDEPNPSFEGIAGHRYLAVGREGWLEPVGVSSVEVAPDLSAIGQAADYLAIGPEELLAPLGPLLELRTGQGYHVMAIPDKAIYDQFGWGDASPETIRNFLKYAVANWQLPPEYVLLVGDASYDPNGYLTSEDANRLPVFWTDTLYGGQTASDVGFAQLVGDDWPLSGGAQPAPFELAIGRVPARTASQVSAWVKKVVDYEMQAQHRQEISVPQSQDGLATILAIADGQEPRFQLDAQRFLDLFSKNPQPDKYQTDLLTFTPGQAGANQSVTEGLNAGNLIVAYFGHGSLGMWGKDRLFTVEDVKSLRARERLSVVLNMTCLTGLFTHPTQESLAEALLWQPDGGAIAVLAPTSLTVPEGQESLSSALVEAWLTDPQAPLGEILRRAREKIPDDDPQTRDVLNTFLLFGDPALQLDIR
jgi:hypothetical protein